MRKQNRFFYGYEVSDEAERSGFVDYHTLSRVVKPIEANTLAEYVHAASMDVEVACGNLYDEDEDEYAEVYQWFVVDSPRLLEEAGEYVEYVPCMDIYLWGVTHYGTPWTNVITNIKLGDE